MLWFLIALLIALAGAFQLGYGWHGAQKSEAYDALPHVIVGGIATLIGAATVIGAYFVGVCW